MEVEGKRMVSFLKQFEEKIFPTIVGSDGKGIKRLSHIVEKKRIDVENRKKGISNI